MPRCISWVHPRSKRAHLIDYVIIRRNDLKNLKCTRAMRGPDCYTDHYLIKSTFKFAIQKTFSKTGAERKRRINTAGLEDPGQRRRLERAINTALRSNTEESVSPNELWNSLHRDV